MTETHTMPGAGRSAALPLHLAAGAGWCAAGFLAGRLVEGLPAPLVLVLSSGMLALIAFFPARRALQGFQPRVLGAGLLCGLFWSLAWVCLLLSAEQSPLHAAVGMLYAAPISARFERRSFRTTAWPAVVILLIGASLLIKAAALRWDLASGLAVAGALAWGAHVWCTRRFAAQQQASGMLFLRGVAGVVAAQVWRLVAPVQAPVSTETLAMWAVGRERLILAILLAAICALALGMEHALARRDRSLAAHAMGVPVGLALAFWTAAGWRTFTPLQGVGMALAIGAAVWIGTARDQPVAPVAPAPPEP